MIKENRSKNISEIVFASKALVEYLINCHDYCTSNWCRPKNNRKEQIRKKEKSLAHHFIEINIMMLSYTTKFKEHIVHLQPKLDLKSQFTFMIPKRTRP